MRNAHLEPADGCIGRYIAGFYSHMWCVLLYGIWNWVFLLWTAKKEQAQAFEQMRFTVEGHTHDLFFDSFQNWQLETPFFLKKRASSWVLKKLRVLLHGYESFVNFASQNGKMFLSICWYFVPTVLKRGRSPDRIRFIFCSSQQQATKRLTHRPRHKITT